MYNYLIDISKIILQNRNPAVIVGNVITYLNALLKPLNTMSSDLQAFVNAFKNKEQYTFQTASMEFLLNELYSPNTPNITIVTQKSTNVEPLANRYSGNSLLGTRTSLNGWFLPNKDQADIAASINDDFIVYLEPSVFTAHKSAIETTLRYYMYSGLNFQVRRNDDIINPDSDLQTTFTQN